MSATARTQRTYDHRFREIVRSSGKVDLATQRGVPRSTARGWVKAPKAEVVSIDAADKEVIRLRRELYELQQECDRLMAVARLAFAKIRASGASLANQRVANDNGKRTLLKAIERSLSCFPLRVVLHVVGRVLLPLPFMETGTRSASTKQSPPCPRSSPHQLTAAEVETIKTMVTSEEYRHVSTGNLAVLAQRLRQGLCFSFHVVRLVRLHRWRRPRKRVHPAKPKVGIRASRPNEIWHIDTTIIRLLDSRHVYLHAVADNYSRKILAWKVVDTFDPSTTAEILKSATRRPWTTRSRR